MSTNTAQIDRTVAESAAWLPMLLWTIALAAILLAYAPLLMEFAGWQWTKPHYQFFPFVIAAFVGLLGHRWSVAPARNLQGRRWPTVGFVVASWLTLVAAVVLYSPMLSAVSLLLLCGGLCSELARHRSIRYLWGIWMLLWLTIPLPLGTDYRLIAFLQLFSSQLSSSALDVLGVLHLMEGNTLLLPEKQLFVDEACSGIVSILSVVSCAAIFGVWKNRAPLHVALLVVIGICWATMLNVLRITTIAYTLDQHGLDWSAGAAHETLGLVLLLLAFGALVATDLLLVALLTEVRIAWTESTGHELVIGRWIARAWDGANDFGAPKSTGPVAAANQCVASPLGSARLFIGNPTVPVVLGIAFATLAMVQTFYRLPDKIAATELRSDPNVQRALRIDSSTLPATLAGSLLKEHYIEHRESQHIMGEYSVIFKYADRSGATSLVSCDFAYPGGWHELAVCYRGLGWELISRRIVVPLDDVVDEANDGANDGASERASERASEVATAKKAADRWQYVELVFRKPDGQYAAVAFCGFAADGTPLVPPAEDLFGNALSRRKSASQLGNCFQVQILLTSPAMPTSQRLDSAGRMLVVAREALRAQIIGGDPTTPPFATPPFTTLPTEEIAY